MLHVPGFAGRKEGAPGLVPDAGQARVLLWHGVGAPGAVSTAPSPVCAWAKGEADCQHSQGILPWKPEKAMWSIQPTHFIAEVVKAPDASVVPSRRLV